MVVEAFTDLLFTPDNNHRHGALLGLSNGENDITQPTDLNLLSPQPRDIGPLSFLHSPRYLLASPNATLEPAVTSPLVRSSPAAAIFPLQSPLPPLTPLADFVTPQGWGMISPHGSLNPPFLLDTPNSLSRDRENDKLPLAAPDTLNENDKDQKEADQSGNPSTEQSRCPEVINREDKKEADHIGPRFSFSGDDDILRLRENPPDVRRRLFDEGIDKIPQATTNSEQQPRKTLGPILGEPEQTIQKRTGLRSRITPPPPMAIPTNPFSNYRIKDISEKQNSAAIAESSLDRCTPSMPQASLSHIKRKDKLQMKTSAHIPQRVAETAHLPTIVQCGTASVHTKDEERRPLMTSEASSVLAELKRQRSQVEEGRKNASSVVIPKSLKVSGPNERTCCNCRASQCIKRYCPCFATSNFCGPDCGCRNCENTLNNSSCVGIARKALIERDPNAFVPRIRSSQRQKARGRQTIRGCNCRKGCEKNYCICKENGLICGVKCTCSGPSGCQNHDQSKLNDVQQVLENMPPPKYVDPVLRDTRGLKLFATQSTKASRQDQNGIQMKAEHFASQASPLYMADRPTISANPVVVDYPALPTPTTPSMPYNPFFGQDLTNRKRSLTFGELSGGFKRIKVANPKDSSLPELKQSMHKNVAQPCSELRTGIGASRSFEMPLTSTLLSGDTPPVDGREILVCGSIPTNTVDGNDHLTTSETKSQYVPRILRYKFGSGKSTRLFEHPR